MSRVSAAKAAILGALQAWVLAVVAAAAAARLALQEGGVAAQDALEHAALAGYVARPPDRQVARLAT